MKILTVIGARPQFVKAAVFNKQCQLSFVDQRVVHTGQHFDDDMSLNIFNELGASPPDKVYRVNRRSRAVMTSEIMELTESEINSFRPDIVNVFGDTDTTFAAAVAASKLNVKIMHIESGLRSYNRNMPEEVNRVVVDHLSDYLFCPTKTSVKNLEKEGINRNVFNVGDIMYDAVRMYKHKFKAPNFILRNNKKIAVMTTHRAEVLEDPSLLDDIVRYCNQYTKRFNVYFPVHPNTQKKLKEYNINTEHIICLQPLSYLEMQGLLSLASLVLTDSGGLQKEAYFHNCQCIVLRSETEWPELLASGNVKLWKDASKDEDRQIRISDFGQANTAKKILDIIKGQVK